MRDPRAQYFKRLRRLRRAARRWSVLAGGLGGAAVILTPYQGLGPPDAAWAGGAGACLALFVWRFSELRTLAAQPAPEPPDPVVAAEQVRAKVVAAVERLPAGRVAVSRVRRQAARAGLRGSSVYEPWTRLDQAADTLAGLSEKLGGPAGAAVLEAAIAERGLRDTAHRIASVERALRFAPADARPPLAEARDALLAQLRDGVAAYERLVAAAAGYLAEDGRAAAIGHPATSGLVDAADLLRHAAAGLAELRAATSPGLRA